MGKELAAFLFNDERRGLSNQQIHPIVLHYDSCPLSSIIINITPALYWFPLMSEPLAEDIGTLRR
jgi:hypothetical protein